MIRIAIKPKRLERKKKKKDFAFILNTITCANLLHHLKKNKTCKIFILKWDKKAISNQTWLGLTCQGVYTNKGTLVRWQGEQKLFYIMLTSTA